MQKKPLNIANPLLPKFLKSNWEEAKSLVCNIGGIFCRPHPEKPCNKNVNICLEGFLNFLKILPIISKP